MVGGAAGVLMDSVCQETELPDKQEDSAIEAWESPDKRADSAIVAWRFRQPDPGVGRSVRSLPISRTTPQSGCRSLLTRRATPESPHRTSLWAIAVGAAAKASNEAENPVNKSPPEITLGRAGKREQAHARAS